jgi:hypothetical protein
MLLTVDRLWIGSSLYGKECSAVSRFRLAVLASLLVTCLPSVGCQYGGVAIDPFNKDRHGLVHEQGADSKQAWREATGNRDWGRYDQNWIGL